MPRPLTIQWNYKQWLGDDIVLGMDWDATGMHFHLLMISIQQEPPGSLPNDMALIRRWLRSPSDDVWRRVHPQVFSAWTLRGDRWFNSGMVETFERKAKYNLRPQNGTKSVPNEYDNPPTNRKTVTVEEPVFDSELDQEQATSFVFLEVGLAGIEARMLVSDAVKSHMHNNKSSPKEAADALIAIWSEYEKADIDFKRGVFKFFKEGLWKQPRSEWGRRTYTAAEQREMRSRAEAQVGVWRPT